MLKYCLIILSFGGLLLSGFVFAFVSQQSDDTAEKVYYESRGAQGTIPPQWLGRIGDKI